jgi:RNA ligase (TIGR02306 family)
MQKSTHKVEVVPVVLEPHPNADSLSVVRIFAGYTCCVRTADWKGKTTGAYIPPDSVVDSRRPEFAFLAGYERIKVKKLRGIVSMGLLIPAPPDANIGDDVADYFGVTHYEPKLPMSTGGETERPPDGYRPAFDVDSLRRYAHVFEIDELVWITEKIHGASARYCWHEGRMYCGSRTEWKREDEKNLWWKALKAHPEIQRFCEHFPSITVYGEVYGQVQDLKYGAGKNEVRFAAFDLLQGGLWINPQAARDIGKDLPWVPFVSCRPFDLQAILDSAEGPSLVPGATHVREGIVIKPIHERTHPEIGRVCLKVVGNGYLERA